MQKTSNATKKETLIQQISDGMQLDSECCPPRTKCGFINSVKQK